MHSQNSTSAPTVDRTLLDEARKGGLYATVALLDQIAESGGTSDLADAALAPPETWAVTQAMVGGFDLGRMGSGGPETDDWTPVTAAQALAYVQGIWPEHDAAGLILAAQADPWCDAPPFVDGCFWHPRLVNAIVALVCPDQQEADPPDPRIRPPAWERWGFPRCFTADGVTWTREVDQWGDVAYRCAAPWGGCEGVWYPGDPSPPSLYAAGSAARRPKKRPTIRTGGQVHALSEEAIRILTGDTE